MGRQAPESSPVPLKERFWSSPDEIRRFLEEGIITRERMRAVDENARALGVSAMQLVETAGAALAGMIRQRGATRVLFLCGAGNNGGDGMAAARHLQRILDVTVLYHDSPVMSDLAQAQLSALAGSQVRLTPFRTPGDLRALQNIITASDLIVDALIGIGAQGFAREPILTAVTLAMESGKPIISADVPTPGIMPDTICAFHRAKQAGAVPCDIGIPVAAEICTGPGDLSLLHERDHAAHKGIGGSILVIGGGPYQGAPYLAGLAALRAGADIVRVYSPVFLPEPDIIHVPSAGGLLSPEDTEPLLQLCSRADVVICGPGLGSDSHGVIGEIASACRKAVFDADALRNPLPRATETVYTPHAGEYARITGSPPGEDPLSRAGTLINNPFPGTVLLKGAVDVICDGARTRFNCTGHPAMTVGGTGDVLAGVCGALMVSHQAFDAACIAAYATGRAGERAAATFGYGLVARDLIPLIPQVLYHHTEEG